MLDIITTNQFEKDLKLSKKRGKNLLKLWGVIDVLVKEENLAEKHKPHRLTGNWNSFLECHIEPDWLLIYQVNEGCLYLVRMGSHSDLF